MKKVLTKKHLEIGLHLLFWVVYFIYPIIKFGDHDSYDLNLNQAFRNTIFIGVSVYIVYFVASKRLISTKYLSILALLFMGIIYLNCYLNVQGCQCNFRVCIINKTVEYFLVNAFFMALLAMKRNIISKQILERTEKEKVQAELKSLKAQMNPHFLFNTLNMLYSNAMQKDEVLADKILKLSDSLHYLLHEGDKERVTLSQEIEFICGFIDLQKARLGEKIDVQFSDQIDNSKQNIPPLLLIPFIENAFKYSSMVEGKNIPLIIRINLVGNSFNLYVENKFNQSYVTNQSITWKESGIGIENVRRRLALLFPSKHKLSIDSNHNVFKVTLEIDLE